MSQASHLPNRSDAARKARLEQALAGQPSAPFSLHGVLCRFRLLTDAQKGLAWLEVLAELQRQGIELTEAAKPVAEAMRLRRWCAMAVLDAETMEPLGSVEDWERLADTPTLRHLLEEYLAFEETRQPSTQADVEALEQEVRQHLGKSDRALLAILRTYGISALASFTLSLVRRPASSPQSSSPTGTSTAASS